MMIMRSFNTCVQSLDPNSDVCIAEEALHYNDVIMTTIASQITSLTVVYSTVYSEGRSKKTSKLRVTGLCVGDRWIPRTKGQLRGKCSHLMTSSCDILVCVKTSCSSIASMEVQKWETNTIAKSFRLNLRLFVGIAGFYSRILKTRPLWPYAINVAWNGIKTIERSFSMPTTFSLFHETDIV